MAVHALVPPSNSLHYVPTSQEGESVIAMEQSKADETATHVVKFGARLSFTTK